MGNKGGAVRKRKVFEQKKNKIEETRLPVVVEKKDKLMLFI